MRQTPPGCPVQEGAGHPAPGPSNEAVFRNMLEQRSHVLAAVSRRILICSQISPNDRPCHPIEAGARRHPDFPVRPRRRNSPRDDTCRTQDPARRVRRCRARPRAGAVSSDSFGSAVAHRMAVQATRVLKDLTRLLEQCDRTRHRGDTVLASDAGHSAGDDEKRGGAGSDERARHVRPSARAASWIAARIVYRWRNDKGCRSAPDQYRGPSAF